MPARKIIDLRQLLAEKFPHPAPAAGSQWPTDLPALNEAAGGGLPRGAITELITPGSGSASLLHFFLRQVHREASFLALIDGSDSFAPDMALTAALPHLLWVRCRTVPEAMKAADLLLRDGNFPLVLLDLILNERNELQRVPQTTWYRLQRLVESWPTVFLVCSRRSMVGSAQLKLILQQEWTLEEVEQGADLSRLPFETRRAQQTGLDLAGAG